MAASAAASTAATVYSAKKGSDAAKDAAAAQSASGDKALALEERMYQQTRGDLEPWMTQGSQAVTTLGNVMGLGAGGGGATAPVAPTTSLPRAVPRPGWNTMSPEERAYVSAPSTRRQTKEYLLTGNEALDPSQTGLFAPDAAAPQTMASAMRGSGYVTLQAPDGSTQQVPSGQAQHFLTRGARIIYYRLQNAVHTVPAILRRFWGSTSKKNFWIPMNYGFRRSIRNLTGRAMAGRCRDVDRDRAAG